MYNFFNAQNPYFLSIYFSAVVLVVSFFILNLMLAAIWSTFTAESEKERERAAAKDKMKTSPIADIASLLMSSAEVASEQ
jgi:hypothetical protein